MGYNPLSKLLVLEGDKWAIDRRITTQAFNMERVKVINYFCFSSLSQNIALSFWSMTQME